MDNRPIGVFDSGLGGLTAVKQIIKAMPNEDIIYFGDTGRVPYGNKGRDTIIRYTRDDIEFLLRHNIKAIMVACGTASSVALPYVEKDYGIKIIGVIEPAVYGALRSTKNGKIGVIGTIGTIRSDKYASTIKEQNPDIQVFSNACPMFVPLAENGYADSEAARMIAIDYLTPLKNAGVDTLIMGCTHYPLLERVIGDIMGEGVELISPGAEAAKYGKKALAREGKLSDKKENGSYEFYVSDSPDSFAELGSLFLGRPIGANVTQIEI